MTWLNNKLRLKCTKCGREFPWSFTPQCPDCVNALVDVDYNVAAAKIKPSGPPMERYFDLLPLLDRQNIIDGGEGNTPCPHLKELGKRLGLTNLYGKVEAANPTGTTKDRQGSQAVATFRDLGIMNFVTSSTGNSCTSLARIVERFPDMHMSIFVGDEFLRRVNWTTAKNVTVYWLKDGSFVDAQRAATWFAQQNPGHVAERGFFYFGKREALKVAYMEAVEQIPKPIEYYFQGISSAMGVYSTWKATHQLKDMGIIARIPRIVGIQEETCNPIVRSWNRGTGDFNVEDVIEHPRGLSKSTLRGDPRLAYRYVANAVRDSDGTLVSATQDEMREMRQLVKETEGLDICFTSAMTVAAARNLRASGWLAEDAVIMLNLTGSDRKGQPHARPAFIVEQDGNSWRITPATGDEVGLLERVAHVLAQTAKVPPETEITADTRLVKADLALDSVIILEFSLALEREFGIEISETDLGPHNFSTVGAVTDLIRQKAGASSVIPS